MSNNKLQGYEEVDHNGQLYLFKADFGFLARLKETTGRFVFTIAEELPAGDPDMVRDVLVCSLVKRAGDDCDDLSVEAKRDLIEEFITEHGLQECTMLANHMMTNSMIGSIKKNKIDRHQTIMGLMESLMISRSQIFRNHALLWVYVATISGICACLSIKLLNPLIA